VLPERPVRLIGAGYVVALEPAEVELNPRLRFWHTSCIQFAHRTVNGAEPRPTSVAC
jgi:hypothetical protein